MNTKTLLIALFAMALTAAGCGSDDHDHHPHHIHEDAGADPGDNIDAGDLDTRPDDHDATTDRDADCRGDDCEQPEPGIDLALRPDRTQTTATRVAWHPVDGAARYELVMTRQNEKGKQSEVFALETTDLHAQVPEKHRKTSRASLQVKAYGDGDQAIEESDRIPFACLECGYKPMICHSACKAPSFGYKLRINGDATTYGNAFAAIDPVNHFIPYSYEDYIEAWDLNQDQFRVREYYTDYIAQATSDPVYDRFCGSQLTGQVYFVQSTAGVYQYAVNEAMTTSTFANDGQAMCGTYNDLNGMNLLFNQTSDISPPLVCPANCNLDAGGGGTGWAGNWEEIDPELFPSPIDIADDIFDGDPSKPGWFDDIPVAPILREIAEHGFGDPNGEDTPPELLSLSLKKAVPANRDPRRERHNRIVIDLDRLERDADTYIDEIAKELEEGELYILVRRHTGHFLRPMALVHRTDS